SWTPSMEVYSWSTPSISTSVIAAPGMDDRSTRRRALPSVWPKPRSNGSMTTRAWRGAVGCTLTTRGLRNSLTEPCIRYHLSRLRGFLVACATTLQPAEDSRSIELNYFEYNSTT